MQVGPTFHPPNTSPSQKATSSQFLTKLEHNIGGGNCFCPENTFVVASPLDAVEFSNFTSCVGIVLLNEQKAKVAAHLVAFRPDTGDQQSAIGRDGGDLPIAECSTTKMKDGFGADAIDSQIFNFLAQHITGGAVKCMVFGGYQDPGWSSLYDKDITSALKECGYNDQTPAGDPGKAAEFAEQAAARITAVIKQKLGDVVTVEFPAAGDIEQPKINPDGIFSHGSESQ